MKKSVVVLLICIVFIFNASQSFGQACVLDSSEHADLLTSIKKLKEKLSLVPDECKTGDAKQAFQSVDELKGASGKLQEYITTQSMAMDATQFGVTADTAMRSVNSITQSLKAATTCLKSKDKKDTIVQILSSLSDVTMNLAPVLMAATIFMPVVGQAGLVGKIATGAISKLPIGKSLTLALLVGVSAKVIEGVMDLSTDGVLKMENIEHRNLVAKSICDYQRIHKQVRDLTPLNGGRIDFKRKYEDVKLAINKLKQEYLDVANNKKTPKAKADEARKIAGLIEKFEALKESVETEAKDIVTARTKLAGFDEIYLKAEDPAYRCSIANHFMNTNTIFKDLKLPITDHSKALRNVIDENRQEINESFASSKAKGPGNAGYDHKAFQLGLCVKAADRWKANVAIILGELASEIQNRSESVYKQLLSDPDFNKWRKAASQLEGQEILYEKIMAYISKVGDQSQLIPQSEVTIEFKGVGKLLFEDTIRKKSLAGQWLEHRLDEFDDMVDSFNKLFSDLNYTTNNVYEASLLKAHNDKVRKLKDDFYGAKASISNQYLQIEMDKSRLRMNLENLNPNLFTSNTTYTCNRLEDLVNESSNANKVFNSAKLFCYYLNSSDLITSKTDPFLIKKCVGRIGLEFDDSKSGLNEIENKRTSRYGLTTRTAIVHTKAVELSCPTGSF